MYSFDGPQIANLIGIDPGSNTLGLSVLSFEIKTMELVSIEATTLVGARLFDPRGWQASILGERNARIQALKQHLIHYFRVYNPVNIAVESPFYSKRMPTAYGALMEVLTMIREAVIESDPWRGLYLIDPPSVKNAVGAPGNGDKDIVKNRAVALLGRYYNGDMSALDEHSIDAVAVGYSRWCDLKKSIFQ